MPAVVEPPVLTGLEHQARKQALAAYKHRISTYAKYFQNKAILIPRNDTVKDVNSTVINSLPGPGV